MTAQPNQMTFWLPPPLTPHDHAVALAMIGARKRRAPIRKTTRDMRAELGLKPDPRLA